ncbi:elongation factor P [Candidatus Uhrbacteria bacterium]|nr:elongation factor P [Candidatus Uhrbacteria bacterium]
MAILPTLNSIRVGVTVLVQGEPYQVLWANFVRMQQRKPVMQTKLRNLKNGKVLEMSFKPGDSVEEADLQKRKSSYLYRDANGIYFMDAETYDSVQIDSASLGDRMLLLQEGMLVDILFFNDSPISVSLPPKIDLKVTSAPPPIKGDSASNVTKSITLETGLTLQVPLFIKEGDMIRINTDSLEYVERVT